jgi:hypothetical protein
VEGGSNMVRAIVGLPKKPGMSNEEFEKYWSEIHGPLCVKMIPGLRKYDKITWSRDAVLKMKALVSQNCILPQGMQPFYEMVPF